MKSLNDLKGVSCLKDGRLVILTRNLKAFSRLKKEELEEAFVQNSNTEHLLLTGVMEHESSKPHLIQLVELSVICAVAREWGNRPVNHVVSFIQIRRNHSRKIHAVELKSVISKGRRLEHRVLEIQDSPLLMSKIMKLYSDWQGKCVSVHSSLEACGWR